MPSTFLKSSEELTGRRHTVSNANCVGRYKNKIFTNNRYLPKRTIKRRNAWTTDDINFNQKNNQDNQNNDYNFLEIMKTILKMQTFHDKSIIPNVKFRKAFLKENRFLEEHFDILNFKNKNYNMKLSKSKSMTRLNNSNSFDENEYLRPQSDGENLF